MVSGAALTKTPNPRQEIYEWSAGAPPAQAVKLVSLLPASEGGGRQKVPTSAVAHVVERAGVSRRTFYELFADREECFLAGFDDAISRAARYVLDSYDPEAR